MIKAFLLSHLGATAAVGGLLAVATWLVIALHQRDAANQRIGELRAQLAVADSIATAEGAKTERTAPIVQHDIKTVTRTVTRVDSLRDSVTRFIHDTTVVLRYVQATDSALHACRDLVTSCDAYKTSATATIGALRTEVTALKAMPPKSRRLCGLGGSLGYGTTYDKTGFHVGPSLSAGVSCAF
jgi:hypothetical protein